VQQVDDRRDIIGIVHVLKRGLKPIEQILHAAFLLRRTSPLLARSGHAATRFRCQPSS